MAGVDLAWGGELLAPSLFLDPHVFHAQIIFRFQNIQRIESSGADKAATLG
jgi:hypothetical protein